NHASSPINNYSSDTCHQSCSDIHIINLYDNREMLHRSGAVRTGSDNDYCQSDCCTTWCQGRSEDEYKSASMDARTAHFGNCSKDMVRNYHIKYERMVQISGPSFFTHQMIQQSGNWSDCR